MAEYTNILKIWKVRKKCFHERTNHSGKKSFIINTRYFAFWQCIDDEKSNDEKSVVIRKNRLVGKRGAEMP